jgi:uncharacterized membrane protein
MTHNLLLFLGRFHPLLVHLPIGGLVLLAFVEVLAGVTRWKNAAATNRWILAFVSMTALMSAAAGWMLAVDGSYDRQILNWHRALGSALAGVCLLTFALRQWGRSWAYRSSLATNVLLLIVVSHLGGSITHGRDFLTRYAPNVGSEWVGGRPRNTTTVAACPPMQRPLFEGVIEPILRERCSACHSAERHKGQLRLDNVDGWVRGGQDGPVIKPGRAKESLLIQRLVSPLAADGHMPPEDQPQPTAAEIALIEWWIDAGAPSTAKVSELVPNPEIRRFLEVVSVLRFGTGHRFLTQRKRRQLCPRPASRFRTSGLRGVAG